MEDVGSRDISDVYLFPVFRSLNLEKVPDKVLEIFGRHPSFPEIEVQFGKRNRFRLYFFERIQGILYIRLRFFILYPVDVSLEIIQFLIDITGEHACAVLPCLFNRIIENLARKSLFDFGEAFSGLLFDIIDVHITEEIQAAGQRFVRSHDFRFIVLSDDGNRFIENIRLDALSVLVTFQSGNLLIRRVQSQECGSLCGTQAPQPGDQRIIREVQFLTQCGLFYLYFLFGVEKFPISIPDLYIKVHHFLFRLCQFRSRNKHFLTVIDFDDTVLSLKTCHCSRHIIRELLPVLLTLFVPCIDHKRTFARFFRFRGKKGGRLSRRRFLT